MEFFTYIGIFTIVFVAVFGSWLVIVLIINQR